MTPKMGFFLQWDSYKSAPNDSIIHYSYIVLSLIKRNNKLHIVINGVIPWDEQKAGTRKKLIKMNILLRKKCAKYINVLERMCLKEDAA